MRSTPPGPPVTERVANHTIAPVRTWSLIGNDLTPGHDKIELEVTSDDMLIVDAWLDDGPGVRLTQSVWSVRGVRTRDSRFWPVGRTRCCAHRGTGVPSRRHLPVRAPRE